MTCLLSLVLALLLAFPGGALAESIEDALTSEEENKAIYSEEKVSVEKNDLAAAEGLDPAWRNILLAGSDSRVDGRYGRTDAMIILSVNTETYAVKMTSVMRDTWTPMYGREPQKISAANVFGGPELAMRTLNECFGMNIEDYILIDMQAIEKVIDLLGGVEIDLTETEMYALRSAYNSTDTALITPPETFGENTLLTGEQALAYARLRKIDDDYQRTARQRAALLAIAQRVTQSSSGELLNLIRECMSYVKTDLTITDAIQLALIAFRADLDQIEQYRIPAEGTYRSGIMPENNLWTIQPDFEENTRLLREFIYGQ